MSRIVKRLLILLRLTGLCIVLSAPHLVCAQPGIQFPPLPSGAVPPRKVLDHYPPRPSLPVAFSIPVGPLGFSIPGYSYLLRRQSLVSLDFIGEDRLLFTFRVSGLLQRDADDNKEDKKQNIRAVVVRLPDGKIESEAAWVIPDRSRYLWMLNDAHFLLRVGEGLDEGDSQLKRTAYLRFPGQLLWIQMDPGQQIIISNSLEPANATQSPGEPESTTAKTQGSPSAVPKQADDQNVLVARTLKRSSGEVLRISRVPWTSQTTDWPMNSEGYVERSKESGDRWLLNLNYFAGGNRALAHLDSICPPKYSYVTETKLLVARCDPEAGWKLGLMLTDGKLQWQVNDAANAMWPMPVVAANGSRMARETMLLKRSVDRYKRLLGARDFQGQMVRVFDVDNGKVLLEAPLTPILDGGGNVAISPSGQRVAILNSGAIQIFQLPAR